MAFIDDVEAILSLWSREHGAFLDDHPLPMNRDVLEPRFDQLTAGQEGEKDNKDVVERILTSFKNELHAQMDALVSTERERIRGIELPEDQYRELVQWFTSCLNASFELFWGTIEAMGRVPDTFDPQNPERFLAFNESVALALIEAVREHPEHESLYAQIHEHIDRSSKARREPVCFFRGAAVPSTFDFFIKFAELCSADSVKFTTFPRLLEGLKNLILEATRGRQKAYPFASTFEAWNRLYGCLTRHDKRRVVLTTEREYLPMIENKKTRVVAGENEEEICSEIEVELAKHPKRAQQSIVFLASVLRDGRRVDINKIIRRLKGQYLDVCIVIDAAQDHLLYAEADAVLYGKRFGGTGTSVLMLSESMPAEVREGCEIKSGLDVHTLARTLACVRCETHPHYHYATDYRHLLVTTNHWGFRGGGTYINGLCRRFDDAVSALAVGRHFDLDYETDEPPPDPSLPFKPWKSSRIVVLRKKSDSTISLNAVYERLRQKHGIEVDCFAPEEEGGFQQLLEMANKPFSSRRCRKLCGAILAFQRKHFNLITGRMPALPEVFSRTAVMDERLCKRQCARLKEVESTQGILRILFTIQMIESDVDGLADSLNSVVESL